MEEQILVYNEARIEAGKFFMPDRKQNKGNGEEPTELFGRRMARLRKVAGYTQKELAPELGISPRMVAYYEAQTKYPPTHLLPRLADVLGVSADELLGRREIKKRVHTEPGNRLWKRFKQVEKLPATKRRQLAGVIDTFLETEKIKQAS